MLSYLKKYKKNIFYLGSFAILFFLFKDVALANNVPADAFGLGYADTTGLGSQDIRVTIAKIIRAAFGFLGVIALGLVLYGGFTYMTAGGDEGKIETAKKILVNATIGLAIILSAFSITQFILSRLAGATGFNAGQAAQAVLCADPVYANEHPDLCDDFGGFGGGDDACILNHFVVQSITPNTEATNINDITVRALFSMDVQNNNPGEVLNILQNGVNVNADFAYEYKAGKRLVEATYKGAHECNGQKCAPEGNYQVEVRPEVVGQNGQELEEEPEDCGNLKFPKRTEFRVNTGEVLDNNNPQIQSLRIYNSQNPAGSEEPDQWLPRGRKYPILVNVTDNAGAGYVRVEVWKDGDNANVVTLYDGPTTEVGSDATLAKPYEFNYGWRILSSAEQLTRYIVRVTAYDIDARSTTKETSFVVIGESCDPNG
ncbi:MAG: pilin, partial [bacterium]